MRGKAGGRAGRSRFEARYNTQCGILHYRATIATANIDVLGYVVVVGFTASQPGRTSSPNGLFEIFEHTYRRQLPQPSSCNYLIVEHEPALPTRHRARACGALQTASADPVFYKFEPAIYSTGRKFPHTLQLARMGASASRASRKKGQGPVAKPKSQSAPANRAVLKASSESSAYPLTGLHIDHLRALVRDHPELAAMDIGSLVSTLILPTTKDKSYVEHLRLTSDTARFTSDKADAFVSYAWSMSLATVVDSLRGFSGFIWMDCFVLNQHFKHVITTEVLQGVFGDALQAIGKVFIVASPWRKPVVVERIWCVFEQYTAFEKKAVVTLVCCPRRRRRT